VAVNLIEALGAAEEATQDRVTFYIPSCDRSGEPVEYEEWVTGALHFLSEVGGGATRLPASLGAWLNPETGELIVEDVTLVYSYVDGEAFEQRLPAIRAFLHAMGKSLDQGEVVIDINETFYKIRDFDS
jgi:hypothetical protein